jgi:hypothetical protein
MATKEFIHCQNQIDLLAVAFKEIKAKIAELPNNNTPTTVNQEKTLTENKKNTKIEKDFINLTSYINKKFHNIEQRLDNIERSQSNKADKTIVELIDAKEITNTNSNFNFILFLLVSIGILCLTYALMSLTIHLSK